jgi:hypothetical protein
MKIKLILLLIISTIILLCIYNCGYRYKPMTIDTTEDIKIREEVEKRELIRTHTKPKKQTVSLEKIVQANPSDQNLETPDIILQEEYKPKPKYTKKLNGYAKYCWPNGDCYTGYWKNGFMEGPGCYEWIDGVRNIDTFIRGFPIHDEFEYLDKRYRIVK